MQRPRAACEHKTRGQLQVSHLHTKVTTSIPAISMHRQSGLLTILGRIQGKHPGLKALIARAWETLHPSLALLSFKAINLFEVTFNLSEGMIHVLTQADLTCETTTISFSNWWPHFDTKSPHAKKLARLPNMC